MAALIPEIAYEETQGGVPQVAGDPQRRRRPRLRYWRGIVLLFAGAYFLIPLYAGLRFSFENDAGQFSTYAVAAIPSQTGFSAAFFLSLRLAAVTTVLTMVLMVPTATYVHLKLPKMRRVLDFVTILPIVIPPIVLILGVLEAAPLWLRASPYLLSLVYVILALPFVYRSLDAGLSAIDLKTLVEASRSLGGKWMGTLWHVILPNLRAAMLSATVLTIALVLGEFTMASLDLWTTLPVWIYQFSQLDAHIATAVSMLSLLGTWVLLTVIVSVDRSQSRRTRRRTGAL
ncbi:MAG: ABC transporter permease [Acidimicrobiales bacterium]|jgi:putative spermidine/putrescine transport system permease protein